MEGFAGFAYIQYIYPGSKSCKRKYYTTKILMLAVGQLKLVTCFDPCVYLQQCDSSTDDTIYKYKAKTLNGSCTVNFSGYTGKTVLFVNVATY